MTYYHAGNSPGQGGGHRHSMKRRPLVLGLAIVVLGAAAIFAGLWVGSSNGPQGGFTPGGASHERLSGKNSFGVFLSPLQFDAETRVRLAQALGAHYYRSYPVLLPGWNGECLDDCGPVAKAGLAYFLTIRNTANIRVPATPVADLGAFKDEVARIIDLFKPAIVAVENEEDSGFWNGPTDRYLAELQAGCEVAHSKGIPCSNGGITHTSVTYLVYEHLVKTGQTQKAQDYAQRAFHEPQLQKLSSPDFSQGIAREIDRLNGFVLHYKEAGADYINFHWYSEDADALTQTAHYMEDITGLPAVSNEFGANTEDGAAVRRLMQTVQDLHMDAVVWYSRDVRTARALVNDDGSLRPSGQAFADFVRSHFGG